MKTLLNPRPIASKPLGRHACGNGLFLQVTEDRAGNRARSWLFRYRLGSPNKSMGLSTYDGRSLAAALHAVEKAQALIAKGEDPKDARKKAGVPEALRQVVTFEQAALAYWRDRKTKEFTRVDPDLTKKDRSGEWWDTLQVCVLDAQVKSRRFGDIPCDEIDRDLVVDCLHPIWSRVNFTAGVQLHKMARIFEYQSQRNPIVWEYVYRKLGEPHEHQKVKLRHMLGLSDVPSFFDDLQAFRRRQAP